MNPRRLLAEFRAEVDGNRLVGHAAVFHQIAKVAGGYERMATGAFDATLADETNDVRALVNHDPSKILGRQSAKTLRLSRDDHGLRFEIDLPDTSYAHDLRELVARGDITGASIGFLAGDDTLSRTADGRQLRTHTSVGRLVDVSPVTFPAYDGTSVVLRYHDVPVSRHTAREQTLRVRARLLERK